MRWEDKSQPVQSLIYDGEPTAGVSTEVFAFYASPATLDPQAKGPFPGVVLIHGGGGTAFAEWTYLWAKRGYAAIAMDLAGYRPPSPRWDPSTGALIPDVTHPRSQRTRLKRGGVDHNPENKFQSIGGAIDDDWPYHAVANVIRAHSLLRGLTEVDADRTAVTGISWGGYTTCIVASLDHRFKAAVPVYGCGYLFEGESVQKPLIDQLKLREEWIRMYDPSAYLASCRVPMFFVNGTHDKHYPLDSYGKSQALVQSPKTLRLEMAMKHNHRAGWDPEEIGWFIDHYCKAGPPLPKLGLMFKSGATVEVKVTAEIPLEKATLHFTADHGPLIDRNWDSIPARLVDGKIAADGLPPSATIYLVSVTDQRGAMVTTPAVFE